MAIVGSAEDAVVGDLVPGGVLRAAINLGNPVLAQGTVAVPAGVTVDIARELGAQLGVPVGLVCCDAAQVTSSRPWERGRAGVMMPM